MVFHHSKILSQKGEVEGMHMKRNLIVSLQAKQSLGMEELEISNSFFIHTRLFENWSVGAARTPGNSTQIMQHHAEITRQRDGEMGKKTVANNQDKELEGDAEIQNDAPGCKPFLPPVEVIFSYGKSSSKRTVHDFVMLFNSRFKSLEKILKSRNELSNA